ncbi:hypothetical protein [Caudoviricetes sp.]|nr:hypothetical protein [Caudoviricetes sp.]
MFKNAQKIKGRSSRFEMPEARKIKGYLSLIMTRGIHISTPLKISYPFFKIP